MATPLPISPEVQTPYNTAIKYAAGSALILTAAACTALVPPAAGALGVILAGKTVVILSSAIAASLIASGGLGFAAALKFRAGYQALFNQAVKGTEKEPLIQIQDTSQLEREIRDAIQAKEKLEAEIDAKQIALDKLGRELEESRKKYGDEAAKWKENEKINLEHIEKLKAEIENTKKREEGLFNSIKDKEKEIESLKSEYENKSAEWNEKFKTIAEELESKRQALVALEEENNQISANNEANLQDLKRLEREKERLNKELEEAKRKGADYDEVANQNIELERQIAELKKDPKTNTSKSAESEALKKEIEEYKKNKNELSFKNNELERQLSDLKTQKALSQDGSSQLKREIDALKNEVSQKENELKKNKAELEDKKQALLKAESENGDLKAQLSLSKTRVKTLEDEVQKHNPLQLAQAHAKTLKAKEGEIADLKKEIEDLKESHARELASKVRRVADESAVEIDSLNRKMKRLEDDLTRDKKRLSEDMQKLEKELEEEKKGHRSTVDSHAQEKLTLETSLKDEIAKKEKELDALVKSIDAIRDEHEAKRKTEQDELLLKIGNVKAEFISLQEAHEEFRSTAAKSVLEHEELKGELTLSRRRINDFIEEQKRLREANKSLKEEKENNIELLELRARVSELERLNDGYLEEARGKVSRIQTLESQIAELQKELAVLKGQPLESLPAPKEPTRWSVRKKELGWDKPNSPPEIVNAGQDSKVNTYNVIPNHCLDINSVIAKFKTGADCTDYELSAFYMEVCRKHTLECTSDKEKQKNNPSWGFKNSNAHMEKFLLDLSTHTAFSSETLIHPIVLRFFKIGIYFFEGNVLADFFTFIRPKLTEEALNCFLEGYILRIQKGHYITHDTVFEEVVSLFVELCKKNPSASKNKDLSLFYEAIFHLHNKNDNLLTSAVKMMDSLGLLNTNVAKEFYVRCLTAFKTPDTSDLCIYLKNKLEKTAE